MPHLGMLLLQSVRLKPAVASADLAVETQAEHGQGREDDQAEEDEQFDGGGAAQVGDAQVRELEQDGDRDGYACDARQGDASPQPNVMGLHRTSVSLRGRDPCARSFLFRPGQTTARELLRCPLRGGEQAYVLRLRRSRGEAWCGQSVGTVFCNTGDIAGLVTGCACGG